MSTTEEPRPEDEPATEEDFPAESPPVEVDVDVDVDAPAAPAPEEGEDGA